ncbi:hypothetical protein, partial [Cellulomonas endophytica]|uniref:hypothetical protein n=1 Tax=Cellulomonas endophytica TaxID=2494735 RepID=UPI001012C86D
MSRLLWVGVGAVGAVVGLRRAKAAVDARVPAGARDLVSDLDRWTRAAQLAREEFSVALLEREEELKHRLLGDVDVDELRRRRAADRGPAAAPGRAARGRRPG